MREDEIEQLRSVSRKLVRELGMLDLEPENSDKTPGRWHALIEVSKRPGITISELGRLLLMSVSSISRIVKFLVKKDYLEIKEGEDKREKSLLLTLLGKSEVQKINAFSDAKILGAFEFLTENERQQIVQSITKYEKALAKSRLMNDNVKILTLSTSRTLRRQIASMVTDIQKKEFLIPVTSEINQGIVRAEDEYYYHNSFNFWYAVSEDGKILGCIGLKKLNGTQGEIKKFFVIKEFRSRGVAQKLMSALLKAAFKHKFESLVLGTVNKFSAALKFYAKNGFIPISREDLPSGFERNPFDNIFYQKELNRILMSEERCAPASFMTSLVSPSMSSMVP